jgi:hypothetical protein
LVWRVIKEKEDRILALDEWYVRRFGQRWSKYYVAIFSVRLCSVDMQNGESISISNRISNQGRSSFGQWRSKRCVIRRCETMEKGKVRRSDLFLKTLYVVHAVYLNAFRYGQERALVFSKKSVLLHRMTFLLITSSPRSSRRL